jgi:hypothetical protein
MISPTGAHGRRRYPASLRYGEVADANGSSSLSTHSSIYIRQDGQERHYHPRRSLCESQQAELLVDYRLIQPLYKNLPEWAEMSAYQASFFTADGDGDAHARRLVDITGERLQKMDKLVNPYALIDQS